MSGGVDVVGVVAPPGGPEGLVDVVVDVVSVDLWEFHVGSQFGVGIVCPRMSSLGVGWQRQIRHVGLLFRSVHIMSL